MKSIGKCLLAVGIGCISPLLIWTGAGVALYQGSKRSKLARQVCAIDADCPPGFVCQGGQCVPAS